MINDKTINLLRNLFGIREADDATSRLYAKLVKYYTKDDPRDARFINAELEAMPAMRDAAFQYAQTHYKLKLDPNTGAPQTRQSWDENTLSWVFELQIANDAAGHLAGRQLIIKVQPRAANNNFNVARMKESIDAKFKAAAKFYRDKNKYQTAIVDIMQSFSQEIETLSAQFEMLQADPEQGRKAVIRKVNALKRKIIARLCENIYKAAMQDFHYKPNTKEMLAARAALQRCEVEMISQAFDPDTPRPVLLHIYFQDNKAAHQLRSLLNVVEPLSDTSSDLRDEFLDNNPANIFKITNQCIFLDRGESTGTSYNYHFRAGRSESFYRSASWTLLQPGTDLDDENGDLDTPEAATVPDATTIAVTPIEDSKLLLQQKRMIRKFIIELYKQKLIAAFGKERRADGSIDIDFSKPFLVHLSLNTLLSPTWDQKNGATMTSLAGNIPGLRRLHKGVEGTFLTGNEKAQLKVIQKCIEDMDDKEIILVEKERVECVQAILAANPSVKEPEAQRIRSLEMRPRLAYFNAPVGRAAPMPFNKRQLSIAWLDWGAYTHEYNLAGLKLHRRNIREFITSNETNPINRIAIENLFTENIFGSNKAWRHIRKALGATKGEPDKNKIRSLLSGLQPEVQENLLTAIAAYTKIHDFTYNTAPRLGRLFTSIDTEIAKYNDRVANSYMVVAASLFIMNEAMGIANIITCKSGKDRTGLFCILREALIDADNNEKLIENICNAIRYSSAQSINAMNVPGCVGIQVPASILSGLKELFGEHFVGQDRIAKVLNEQQSALVGAMGKAAWGSGGVAAIEKLAAQSTAPKAEPIEITRQAYWPFVGPLIYSSAFPRGFPLPPPGMLSAATEPKIQRPSRKPPAIPKDFPLENTGNVPALIEQLENKLHRKSNKPRKGSDSSGSGSGSSHSS